MSLETLIDAAKAALEEMCHTTAPRDSFTDAVDGLDAAIRAAGTQTAIVEQNIGKFEDIAYDADVLMTHADKSLHGMILGIKATAEQGAASLRGVLASANQTSGEQK